MKTSKLLLSILVAAGCYSAQAQIKFSSNDKTDDGKPLYETELSTRLKFNGYMNLGGNDAAASQSINLNSANPYNKLTDKNMDMNMYQSQMAWRNTYNGFSKGPLTTYIEGQYWGAPGAGGNFQLRVAYVDYNHWHIGQDWTFFGNGVASWYNTLDWEGPNSGTWARHVQVKYYTDFGANKAWKFEGGIESSSAYLKVAGGKTLSNGSNMPGQFSADPIVAFTRHLDGGAGFLRLAVMGRPLRYADQNSLTTATTSNTMGWGANANYKTTFGKKSYFMAQGIVGSGIGGSYTMSGALFGNGTPSTQMNDAFYDQNGKFQTVPIYGASAGVEHYFGAAKRFHSNLVLGYTTMTYDSSAAYLVASGVVKDNPANDFVNNNTNSSTRIALPSATINAMWDVTKNFMIGIEYNTGAKQIINSTTQTSMVNRIAFGAMIGF